MAISNATVSTAQSAPIARSLPRSLTRVQPIAR